MLIIPVKDLIDATSLQDSVTTTKDLDVVPSIAEALQLLENRKKFHIPDETKRVYPSKEKEEKKVEEKEKKKKRKRDSSSPESATKEVAATLIKTVVPLVIRSVEGEVSVPLKKQALGKGKEKVDESAPVAEPLKEVAYNRRDVIPFNPGTLFSELGYKGMVTRFNRASAQLVSQKDVDNLDSVSPLDRVRQLQSSAADVRVG